MSALPAFMSCHLWNFSRTLSHEKPQNVEPQSIAQGALALPGKKKKRILKLSPAFCTFPTVHFHQPAEVAHRDVTHKVLGTSARGQKPNPAQFAVGDGVLASGHPLFQLKQLHLAFHERN